MAGNLGASNDESTWVLTSYLVSNAIVLPISGWLAVTFGRKRFFMACLIIFTLSSLLCGIAPSLGFLLLFRVMQGAGRRRTPADGASDPGGHFSAAETGLGIRAVRHHSCHGAHHRTDPGRLDHLQLLLALDLLYQSAGRSAGAVSGSSPHRRSSVSEPASKLPGSNWITSESPCWRWASAPCRFCWTRARRTTGSAHISS